MGVTIVENQVENAADDFKFMGQKGKHWPRKKWKISPLLQREKNYAKPREQSKMLANHRSGTALTLYLSFHVGCVFSQLIFPIQFPERSHCHQLGKILGHPHQLQNGLSSGAARFYDLHPLMGTSNSSRRKMMASSEECILFQAICFWRLFIRWFTLSLWVQ